MAIIEHDLEQAENQMKTPPSTSISTEDQNGA
jgi:hypothetical protein